MGEESIQSRYEVAPHILPLRPMVVHGLRVRVLTISVGHDPTHSKHYDQRKSSSNGWVKPEHRDLCTIDVPLNAAIVFEVVGFQLTEERAWNSEIWAQATVLWSVSREFLCQAGDVLARVISNVDGAPRSLDLLACPFQIVEIPAESKDTSRPPQAFIGFERI